MDCTKVEGTIRAWLDGPLGSGADLDECAGHISSCPVCREGHGRLLPLMSRDARGSCARPPADEDIVNAVMDRIGSSRPERAGPPATAFLRFALPLAAAAVLAAAILLPRWVVGGPVMVTFRLYAPEAASVGIAADFNGWSPSGYELKRSGAAGNWEITVPLERGKMYLYNFVLDGQTWIADPDAQLIMDDGFGSKSSALSI